MAKLEIKVKIMKTGWWFLLLFLCKAGLRNIPDWLADKTIIKLSFSDGGKGIKKTFRQLLEK